MMSIQHLKSLQCSAKSYFKLPTILKWSAELHGLDVSFPPIPGNLLVQVGLVIQQDLQGFSANISWSWARIQRSRRCWVRKKAQGLQSETLKATNGHQVWSCHLNFPSFRLFWEFGAAFPSCSKGFLTLCFFCSMHNLNLLLLSASLNFLYL